MAKAKEAKASKSQNGGDAPTAPGSISEAPKDGEGPVLTIITKRLRAANKKLKRVEEIESSRAAGKTLNADQVCEDIYSYRDMNLQCLIIHLLLLNVSQSAPFLWHCCLFLYPQTRKPHKLYKQAIQGQSIPPISRSPIGR